MTTATETLPTYTDWSAIPAELATRTQLRADRLFLPPDVQPVALMQAHYDTYKLYRRADALPMAPKRERHDYTPDFTRRYPTRRAAYLQACEACFELNKYAKHATCSRAHQTLIYDLKTRFVAKLWREGFCTGAIQAETPRHQHTCWECDGEGCYRCNMTGIFRESGGKPFWALRFVVDGKTFAWHQPARLCPWASAFGDEQPHAVLAEERPVALAARNFAQAKALLAWVLEDKEV